MAYDGLRLRPEHLAQMREHVDRAWPNEGCGLLGGPAGRVEYVYRLENALHSPVEYALDPVDQVRVMLAIEDAGWELVGIFHSHPAGPPRPSATDVARAYYPEAVYVILAPGLSGSWEARAFRILEGAVEEVALQIAE